MWKLNFITKEQLCDHVEKTIIEYQDKLQPYNIKKFNSNIIDPIKLIFDKTVYQLTWSEMIKNEIYRQRDKSNNNSIGYFHQNIFSYISNCDVPKSGWDIIVNKSVELPDGDTVESVYVELKNKHNTMNSSSSSNTYIKMQNQLLRNDSCACFLVEVIAKKSQNIKWETSVDKQKVSHKRIRRVSIDEFYAIITGDDDAFYQLCLVLPEIINLVITNHSDRLSPKDTVFEELKKSFSTDNINAEDYAMSFALYMLGFSSYKGF